ncbi:MAG: fluoride efflux transporter FluC [Terrabacter sp.]
MGVSAGEPQRAQSTSAPPRAVHRHPGLLALIFVGGALGTGARASLEDLAPADPAGVPWMTLCINVIGSLLLGLLLETLARTGDDTGGRRAARLTLGTGVLGGFTTYSTFAVEAVRRLESGSLAVGLGYSVCSVVLGAAAAAGGYVVARRITRHLTVRSRR